MLEHSSFQIYVDSPATDAQIFKYCPKKANLGHGLPIPGAINRNPCNYPIGCDHIKQVNFLDRRAG
jgi:hypothetical protein